MGMHLLNHLSKLTLFICVIILISGCRSARYAKHYKANLEQFSRLIGSVQKPDDFGDSIVEKLNYSILSNRRMISGNTKTNLTLTGAGAVVALVTPALPIVADNKKLVSGVALTVAILSAVDLFVSVTEPKAYDKKATEVVANWENSRQDNAALTALRASLLSLQETWPAYAP